EQPPSGPDERPALDVLAIARLLAYEDHPRPAPALAEHGLRRIPVEVAAPAALRLLAHTFEGGRHRPFCLGSHGHGSPQAGQKVPHALAVARRRWRGGNGAPISKCFRRRGRPTRHDVSGLSSAASASEWAWARISSTSRILREGLFPCS